MMYPRKESALDVSFQECSQLIELRLRQQNSPVCETHLICSTAAEFAVSYSQIVFARRWTFIER